MRNKTKKNIQILLSLCAVTASATGCSISSQNNESISVGESVIKEQVKVTLNEQSYAIDDLSSFKSETVAFTEEEKTDLAPRFTSKAVVKKYLCDFTATSIQRDISGQMILIYAYVNDEWILVSSTPYELDSWKYSAKDVVTLKQIRDDLKTIDINGLNGSKVGDELNTDVEIEERNSDIANGNDSISINITYNAEFAIYSIDAKLQYRFKDGNWVLDSAAVDDQEFWSITFNENEKPKEPKESYMVNELSQSSNYKNYMMNLSYVDNYYITKGTEAINGNELNYNYILIVTYEEFGDIEYNVTKKYTWENGGWQEGELEVSLKSADWQTMIGTWSSVNGDFIRFTDLNNQTLLGYYTHKYDNGNYITYQIEADIDLELTDNNWDMMITQGNVLAGEEEEHFVILPFKMNLKDGTLTSNGSIYISRGDEEGGPGFILNEDGSYYIEKPEEEDEEPTEDEEYHSGLTFFEEETEDAQDTPDEETLEE